MTEIPRVPEPLPEGPVPDPLPEGPVPEPLPEGPVPDPLPEGPVPEPLPEGPAPGLLATADRLGRALAGGTGLREPGEPVAMSPRERRRNLARLIVILVVVVAAAVVLHGLLTLVVIVALTGFVMLHEFGHLVMAKRSGMKVTEYFVGFGPKLWSVRKGETEYGIKALPLGGYVRILGMNNLDRVAAEDEPRTYRQQSFARRFGVAIAGSSMHFVVALVLLLVLNLFVGVTNPNKPLLRVAEVEALTTGPSPAQQAGFEPGDTIVTVDGHPVVSFDDLRTYIEQRPGVPIMFGVQRKGQLVSLRAVPVDLRSVVPQIPGGAIDTNPPPTGPEGFLGISPALARDRAGPVVSVGRTVVQFGRTVGLTAQALASILSPAGISHVGRQLFGGPSSLTPTQAELRPVSPVGIVHITNQAAKQGAEPLLGVLVGLNVIVGVFNLIPLLPFDGGLVAIAVYERIRSRRGQRHQVDVSRLLPLTYGVFLVLVLLFVSALYLDITRPL